MGNFEKWADDVIDLGEKFCNKAMEQCESAEEAAHLFLLIFEEWRLHADVTQDPDSDA